jgi:hypothetical protein
VKLKDFRRFLLYCTIINYGLLILWYVILILPHGWVLGLVSGNVKVSLEDFDKVNFLVMVFYKVAIIFFNLIPCIVLYLMREPRSQAE